MAKNYPHAPEMQLEQEMVYQAIIHTSKGDITVDLFSQDAPLTVNNFVFLAEDGYFNDVIFHRIIKGFMIQTGDPMGTGTGGPGYQFQDELPPAVPYEPGVVAMANAGPNTNGSQFFICSGEHSKNLNQQPNYTVFGRVAAGMDIVKKLEESPVGRSAMGEMSKPVETVKITSVEVVKTPK